MLRRVNTGDPITADTFNAIIDALNGLRILGSSGVRATGDAFSGFMVSSARHEQPVNITKGGLDYILKFKVSPTIDKIFAYAPEGVPVAYVTSPGLTAFPGNFFDEPLFPDPSYPRVDGGDWIDISSVVGAGTIYAYAEDGYLKFRSYPPSPGAPDRDDPLPWAQVGFIKVVNDKIRVYNLRMGVVNLTYFVEDIWTRGT